mmetsp:Transcript_32984/g.71241  ORF Transcript_32984/g.71241 Transcript_32984/m.71241 type:complete len:176 (+) Transcript_32984:470-997(+)
MHQHSLPERQNTVKRFYRIANLMFDMNNFNGFLSIETALHKSSVHRLKRTMTAVAPEDVAGMERRTEVLSEHKSYKLYRDKLRKITPPCIPYIGVDLKDLTYITENPRKRDGLINFSRIKKEATTIARLQDMQNTPYTFREIPKLMAMLEETREPVGDKELHRLSHELEPRQALS